MIIAFDTFILSERHRNVGIFQYAKNLFLEFQKLLHESESLSFRYFIADGYSEKFLVEGESKNFHPVRTNLINFESLWRLGLVNVAALNANADLLFSPAPKLLPAGIPAVVTIHDIMTAKLPPKLLGWTSAHRLTAYSWMAAKLSSKIITDSEHSKKDIAETFDIDPEKIAVVYLGYDNHTFNTDPIDIGRKHATYSKYGIARPYIIHHGMVQSRKNILGLIEAYKILCQTRKIDFDLVLAGGFGHGSEEVRRQAAAFSGGTVILTGPLSDDELGVILKGASLAVIPSFYEGFCLPIVEAMACGIPTIGANNSCIPEISGHVLRYFDARSSEEMASAMSDTLESSTLQHNLSVAGLSQASKYSWQRCARETLDAICNTQIK